MKITPRIKRFQQGGPMPSPEEAEMAGAPAEEAPAGPEQGGDPLLQLVQLAAQALQAQDPNMAFQVCQALVELAQSAAPAPAQEPVFRKGGVLVRRIRK